MNADGFRRLSETTVHQGGIWHVAVAEFESPDGTRFRRDIVRSPGAVTAVPVLIADDGAATVVLVRQWRPSIEREMLEAPAGMRDVDGEDPAGTAYRELIEEAGYQAAELELLTMYHPSAGMTDGTHHVYLATGLTAVPRELDGPEEQFMDVVHLPLGEAISMIRAGEITASNTVIGLLLAERRLIERGLIGTS
jgi:8-oxo-dGTP pyrophosphatase MutT (NUDIX family)